MSKERNVRPAALQGVARDPFAQDVLVFIQRRSVRKDDIRNSGISDWPGRKLKYPPAILGGELIPGPHGGIAGDWIEIFDIAQPAGRSVVVTANEDRIKRSRLFHYVIGARPIADDVSEIGDPVIFRKRSHRGFKGLEVCMDIAEDENAHEGYGRGLYTGCGKEALGQSPLSL